MRWQKNVRHPNGRCAYTVQRSPAESRNGQPPSARGAGIGPCCKSSCHSLGHSHGGRPVVFSWQHSALPGHECFAHSASAFFNTDRVSFNALRSRGSIFRL